MWLCMNIAILELKSIITKMKSSLEKFSSMFELAEERISELKDRSFEITRSENKKKKEKIGKNRTEH